MIRQIWKQDPTTDICLLYTIHGEHTAITAQLARCLRMLKDWNHWPIISKIPSVHMGVLPALLEKGRKAYLEKR